MWVRKGDPSHPELTDWRTSGREMMGEPPWTISISAPVEPLHTYRVQGNASQVACLGMQLFQHERGRNRPSAALHPDQLQTAPNGDFELYLGDERPPGVRNWLPLRPGDDLLIIRGVPLSANQTLSPLQLPLTITRVDHREGAFRTLAEREMRAAAFFTSMVLATLEAVPLLNVNAFTPLPLPVQARRYGESLFLVDDVVQESLFVRLRLGEVLEITGRLPHEARHGCFFFSDRWFSLPESRSGHCWLPIQEVQLDEDGTYRLHVSPEDAGYGNWIETGALHEGIFTYRFARPTDPARGTVRPTVRVITSRRGTPAGEMPVRSPRLGEAGFWHAPGAWSVAPVLSGNLRGMLF